MPTHRPHPIGDRLRADAEGPTGVTTQPTPAKRQMSLVPSSYFSESPPWEPGTISPQPELAPYQSLIPPIGQGTDPPLYHQESTPYSPWAEVLKALRVLSGPFEVGQELGVTAAQSAVFGRIGGGRRSAADVVNLIPWVEYGSAWTGGRAKQERLRNQNLDTMRKVLTGKITPGEAYEAIQETSEERSWVQNLATAGLDVTALGGLARKGAVKGLTASARALRGAGKVDEVAQAAQATLIPAVIPKSGGAFRFDKLIDQAAGAATPGGPVDVKDNISRALYAGRGSVPPSQARNIPIQLSPQAGMPALTAGTSIVRPMPSKWPVPPTEMPPGRSPLALTSGVPPPNVGGTIPLPQAPREGQMLVLVAGQTGDPLFAQSRIVEVPNTPNSWKILLEFPDRFAALPAKPNAKDVETAQRLIGRGRAIPEQAESLEVVRSETIKYLNRIKERYPSLPALTAGTVRPISTGPSGFGQRVRVPREQALNPYGTVGPTSARVPMRQGTVTTPSAAAQPGARPYPAVIKKMPSDKAPTLPKAVSKREAVSNPPPQSELRNVAPTDELLPPPNIVPPPQVAGDMFGFREIDTSLSRVQRLLNSVSGSLGKDPFWNPYVQAAKKEYLRLENVVHGHAMRMRHENGQRLSQAFDFSDNWTIDFLNGIDDTLPGPPALSDLAARLPIYWDFLNEAQKSAILILRDDMARYRRAFDEAGLEVWSRPDVMEGGFYFPRGNALEEGMDAYKPIRVKPRGPLGRGLPGGEKPSEFLSQAEGISKKYEYSSLPQVLYSFGHERGARILKAHIENYFKGLTDDAGTLLGETVKARMLRQNPAVRRAHEELIEKVLRFRALGGRLGGKEDIDLTNFLYDPDFGSTVENIRELQKSLSNATFSIYTGEAGTAASIAKQLNVIKSHIKQEAPKWKKALSKTDTDPRDMGKIDLPGLKGRSWSSEMANAANKWLRDQAPPTGLGADVIRGKNAFDSFYLGMGATADFSQMGIQGIMGLGTNPKAYGLAARASVQSWGRNGDAVLGKFLIKYDEDAIEIGGQTVSEWVDDGIRLSGGEGFEMKLGQGPSSKLAQLPLVRQANRAFSNMGDAQRLAWAQDELLLEMHKTGKTAAELRANGSTERIARVLNGATGWSPNRFGQDKGQLLLLAPRFLQARIETITRGAMGMRFGAPLEQRIARRSVLRYLTGAFFLTIGLNEALGNKTDFRPYVNGRRNTNFMRVRFLGRDYSLFGTYGGLLYALMDVASGHPERALRSMGAGSIKMGWDLLTGEDFIGRKTRESAPGSAVFLANLMKPEAFTKYILMNFVPWAAERAAPEVGQVVVKVARGNFWEAGGHALAVGTEMIGASSSPTRPFEKLEDKFRNDKTINPYGYDYHSEEVEPFQEYLIKKKHPELVEKGLQEAYGERHEPRKARAAVDKWFREQTDILVNSIKNRPPSKTQKEHERDIARQYMSNEASAFNQKKGITGLGARFGEEFPDDPTSLISRYYALGDKAIFGGVFRWDLLPLLREYFFLGESTTDEKGIIEEGLKTPEDRNFVLRNINLREVPDRLMDILPKNKVSSILESKKARDAFLSSSR